MDETNTLLVAFTAYVFETVSLLVNPEGSTSQKQFATHSSSRGLTVQS